MYFNIFQLPLQQYIRSHVLNIQAFWPNEKIILTFIEKKTKKIWNWKCP